MRKQTAAILIASLVLVISMAGYVGQRYVKPAQVMPEEFSFLAPDALNVKQLDLSEIGAKELNYLVQLNFPDTAISPQQYERLNSYGWKKCKGVPIGWSVYEDDSHQGVSYCVWSTRAYLAKGNRTMSIAQEYTEPRKSGTCSNAPSSAEQQVIVTVYEHSTAHDVRKMGLICEGLNQ